MKYNYLKLFVAALLCFLLNNKIFSQEADKNKAEGYVGVDFASQYVWRGLVLTERPVIQPTAEISFKQWNVGLWGSTSFVAYENKELDMYVNYTYRNFKLTLIDYFTYSDSVTPSFFNYRKDKSAHIIETIGEFTGSDKIPFRFLAAVNLFGDSANSTYFEAAWLSKLGESDVEVLAGYTPQIGYYNESKKGFTNIGASIQRTIPMNDTFSVCFKFSVFYAPLVDQTYFAILIGLN